MKREEYFDERGTQVVLAMSLKRYPIHSQQMRRSDPVFWDGWLRSINLLGLRYRNLPPHSVLRLPIFQESIEGVSSTTGDVEMLVEHHIAFIDQSKILLAALEAGRVSIARIADQ
ncbi:hypothetical protein G3O06_32040 [Burkholderia sp. Ac-20345]|uniref:hypothetical protein n=1 Tax=Burkholderia sp. Ac-20345 TaxID=2703891 RepID=UPI00197B884D|nr:hypothetical protein [Burkholderia sp. Ac-20345]MBN3782137.1 hypothetical protein [Burkholderia sp. Ac-20345]